MTRALRILGLVAVLTLICAVLGTGSASAGETDPDPLAGAPTTGDCYNITYQEGYQHAIADDVVDCDRRHTLVVAAVGEIPASVDWAAVDWDDFPSELSRAISATCNPAAAKILGSSETTKYLSLYSEWWFAPTRAQIADGARWFSCEIGLDDGKTLLPLPKGRPSRVTKPVDADVARCVNARNTYVTCNRAHAWRATSAFLVKKKLTEKNRQAAAGKCARRVSSQRWLFSTRAVAPRQFVVACYSKTRR